MLRLNFGFIISLFVYDDKQLAAKLFNVNENGLLKMCKWPTEEPQYCRLCHIP